MVSLRCKKVLSVMYVAFSTIALLISLKLDTGSQEMEYSDILLILAYISLPVSIFMSIYYCSGIENSNAITSMN